LEEKQKLIKPITNSKSYLSSRSTLNNFLIYCKVHEGLKAIENGDVFTNDEMRELILKC
jgi:predicted transcriptional regulator